MAEGGKETGSKKLRVIKGGIASETAPERVIEVGSIGEYKPDHPSAKHRPPPDPTKITPIRKK